MIDRPCRIRLALLFLVLTSTSASAAQTVPTVAAGPATGSYGRQFTDLRSLRVLSDGGLIAIEGVGGEVVLLHPDGVSETPVGRNGSGPGEYREPWVVAELADSDFSMLADAGLERLMIIDGSGNVIASERWFLPMGALPAARDASEGIYFDEVGVVRTDRAGRVREGPAPLLRARPGTSVDTVAMLAVANLTARWEASPVSRMMRPGPNGFVRFRAGDSPFGAQDQWTLLRDGRLAIVRFDPYRVEIVSPESGEVVAGEVVPYEPIPVSEVDRREFLINRNRGRQGGAMSFSIEGGGSVQVESRPQPVDPSIFPATKPPFAFGSVRSSPDGEVWVQRYTAADDAFCRIDVFDQTGTRVRQVTLAAGCQLKAVGSDAFYVVRFDADDLQVIERYER